MYQEKAVEVDVGRGGERVAVVYETLRIVSGHFRPVLAKSKRPKAERRPITTRFLVIFKSSTWV